MWLLALCALMSTFVALNMSTDWLIAFPNGDSCSYISSLLRYSSNCCFTGSAMLFDWILAISLTAISSILRSTGSMLPSTSIASLPDVAGNPKHIDNPFLWIASNYTPPPPQAKFGGYIGITLSVRLSVRPSGYIYMDCPAISSYSFGATAVLLCRMFIHIMEVCMSTWFWFSSNILKRQVVGLSHFFHTSCIKGTWFVQLTPPTVLELQL